MWIRRTLYFVLLAFSIGLLLLVPHQVSFALTAAVVIAPILSLLMFLSAIASFRMQCSLNQHKTVRGSSVLLHVQARCRFFLSYAVVHFCFSNREQNRTVCADMRSKMDWQIALPCDVIGIQQCGVVCVEFRDLFGLVRWSKPQKAQTVAVYPQLFPVSHGSHEMDSSGQLIGQLKSLQKDPVLVASIRDYQQDDSIRSVHWKLSSKMNRLMVKNHESIAPVGTRILANLDAPSPACTDRILECIASLTQNAVENQLSAQVVASHLCERVYDREDQKRLLGQMLTVKEQPVIEFADCAGQFCRQNPTACPALVFTAKIDPLVEKTLSGLRRSGYDITVVVVADTKTTSLQNDMLCISSTGFVTLTI